MQLNLQMQPNLDPFRDLAESRSSNPDLSMSSIEFSKELPE